MSDGYSSEHYHLVTQRSQAAEIIVPIPTFCKPLAATVRPSGERKAGLLASFFDPEQHAWVVRRLPVHESCPHQSPLCLIVRVITLVDPANLYELRVSLSSVLDDLDNDEFFSLQRRSQIYRLLLEEHLEDKSGATLRCAAAEGRLPKLTEAVTLAAPLDVMDGFVLTGGGFLSDFPVLRDGPALPRSMGTVYDDILAGSDFCGPPMPVGASRFTGKDSAAKTYVSTGRDSPGSSQDPLEYTAWSVTAAANGGLVCLSIGLRRRSPIEWSQLEKRSPQLHAAFPHKSTGSGASLAISSGPVWAKVPSSVVVDRGALAVVHGFDAPVSGLGLNRDSDGGSGAQGFVNTYSSPAVPTRGSRPLLETLTLRGEVNVTLPRRDGEEWCISLPPPHGSLKFPMGPNRELMMTARTFFYLE
ncbi:hypothetical protein, conserved [Leishmania tarentolae]|uniref:Uncharacterized protein n=1 Tax=Leishmania tarentolae TaxID=5689 RepID=A0A640KQX7_LEITA|nr:hypothetical protein, conserved [Leishmania tarentolae]